MGVEVRVNGETFNLFKRVSGERSIDTFAREIQIVLSEQSNNESFLKMGDKIEVLLDGILDFTGYIERIADNESRDNHDITYRARSSVADLIDSIVPDNVKSLEGVSLFAGLVQLCIDGQGLSERIKVLDYVGASFGDSSAPKAAETGQTIVDFLQDNARIVQVFLNDDGEGNVLITRPGGKHATLLQNITNSMDNNIISCSMALDNSQRFNKFIVYSNGSINSENVTDENMDLQGEAVDSEISETRISGKVAEKPLTSDECTKAAEEEVNIRRARSFSYSCIVAGFSGNGELWQQGKGVTLKDDRRGIDGLFVVNTVSWDSSESGEIVNMDITLPDKGFVEAEPSIVVQEETKAATTYTVQAGDNLTFIARDLGVSLNSLIAANPQIDNPSLIHPDQQIRIPNSE